MKKRHAEELLILFIGQTVNTDVGKNFSEKTSVLL